MRICWDAAVRNRRIDGIGTDELINAHVGAGAVIESGHAEKIAAAVFDAARFEIVDGDIFGDRVRVAGRLDDTNDRIRALSSDSVEVRAVRGDVAIAVSRSLDRGHGTAGGGGGVVRENIDVAIA